MAAPEKVKKASPLSIGLSIVAILMVATFIFNNFENIPVLRGLFAPPQSPGDTANNSLQMSVEACKRRAKLQLGEKLLRIKLDERSTRFVEASNQYLVFLDATIEGVENKKYYFECRVSAQSQAILNIDLTGPPREFQQIKIR